MKITTRLLFKINTEGLAVELATRSPLTDDRTKARDEQSLDAYRWFHGFSCAPVNPNLPKPVAGNFFLRHRDSRWSKGARFLNEPGMRRMLCTSGARIEFSEPHALCNGSPSPRGDNST